MIAQIRFLYKIDDLCITLNDAAVAFAAVGKQAVCAILEAVVIVAEIPFTALSECVQGTIAEQAVEIFGVLRLVTGKILTLTVLKERIMLFIHTGSIPPERFFLCLQVFSVLGVVGSDELEGKVFGGDTFNQTIYAFTCERQVLVNRKGMLKHLPDTVGIAAAEVGRVQHGLLHVFTGEGLVQVHTADISAQITVLIQ